MGDMRWTTLHVHGWPADFVAPGETYRGRDFPDELAVDVLADRHEQLAVEITGAALDQGQVEYDPRTRELRLADEHNYGFESIRGALDALREAGYPYYAAEHADCGRFEAWRPGWGLPRAGEAREGVPVLDLDGYRQMMSGQAKVLEGAALVESWLRTHEEVAEATREEVGADA